jgi:hypothetical protein
MRSHSSPLLDLLTPLERSTLENEIAGYYSAVTTEEAEADRIPNEAEFITRRYRWLIRLLIEISIGLFAAIGGLYGWVYLSSQFIPG